MGSLEVSAYKNLANSQKTVKAGHGAGACGSWGQLPRPTIFLQGQ